MGHRAFEDRQGVVTAVVAVQEVNAFFRLGRVWGEAHFHQVRKTKAHDPLIKIAAALKGWRRQHHVAHAQLMGDKALDRHRRDKAGKILARAPEQLVAIAVRVAELRQGLDLAQFSLGSVAALNRDIGLLQLGDRLLERGLAGQLPTAGTEAVLLAAEHQDTVRALVHFQVQVRAVSALTGHHHAQHLGCVMTPLRQVGGQQGDVTQTADIHACYPRVDRRVERYSSPTRKAGHRLLGLAEAG
ncbi:hypothetical protein D3C79_643180 [compost metagenome]